tara:strand:- start:3342 stop:3881 length:540 start_codon:yes stop_codon:yes gene_type:complete
MQRDILEQTLDQVETVLIELQKLPPMIADRLYVETRCGVHVRHILDHWRAILRIYTQSEDIVDYDRRNRYSEIESNREACQNAIQLIHEDIIKTNTERDRAIRIKSEFDTESEQSGLFASSLKREWLYVINHTIHHLAHIRLLLNNEGVKLPEHLGVAPSTRTFQRSDDEATAEKPVPA